MRRAPGVPFWLLYHPSKSLPEDDVRFVVAREFQPTYEELSAALQEKLLEKTAERMAMSWDNVGLYIPDRIAWSNKEVSYWNKSRLVVREV